MKNLKPKVVERGSTTVDTTVSKEDKDKLEEIKSSTIDDNYMLWILETYYGYVASNYEFKWEWEYVMINGYRIKYVDLINKPTIWGGGYDEHPYTILKEVVDAIDLALEGSGAVLPKFRWRPHQIGEGYRIKYLLDTYGWAYLQHLPRTGKTGTALYAMHLMEVPLHILICTTKNGVKGNTRLQKKGEVAGWMGFIQMIQQQGFCLNCTIDMVTPYQMHKLLDKGVEYDYVFVDEAHKIFSDPKPKPSEYWVRAKTVIGNSKVIFISATPHAQSINQVYWQLALCRYTPFMKQSMDWRRYFAVYGRRKQVMVGGTAIEVYTEGRIDEVKAVIEHGFSTLSQEDVGFKEALLPVDVPCFVNITGSTRAMMEKYYREEVLNVGGVMVHTMNARDVVIRLHQMEGGSLKYVDVFSITDPDTGIRMRGVKPKQYSWQLPSDSWITIDGKRENVPDKVKYIWDTWGDVENLVIFYHYVAEGKILKKYFKKAKVLQGITNAEAIDLYMYDTCVVYSMNWSVSTYIQRRDRQVHLTKRKKPINIYYLLGRCVVGGANLSVSADVYEAVVQRGEDLTMKYYKKG